MSNMEICERCGGDMEIETRVVDTRKADIDESFEDSYVCGECGHERPLKN